MNDATGDLRSSRAEAREDALAYARSIVDTVREPLLVLDSHLRVQSANRSFYRTFRVAPLDTEGRLLYELGNGQWDIPRLHTLLEEILPHNTSFDDFEIEHDFPGIGRKMMLLNARRLRHEEGEQILLAIEDVTERRRAEQAIQESEQRMQRMLNVEGVGVLIFDSSGTLTDANDAFLRMTGQGRDEIEARALSWRAMTPPEHVAESERQMRLLAETGRIGPYEKEYFRKDGSRSWMLFAGVSLGNGTVVKYCIDIDDHRRAEAAMRASEANYRALFEQAGDGIWLADQEGSFIDVNPAGCKMLGYSHDEHVRLTVQDIIRAADAPRLRELMQALAAGQHITDVWEIRRADGRFIPLELSHSITPVGFWQAIGRDITARVEAEEAQRESESRLKESGRRKDEFLATLAHELRNPLAPIRTGLDLIQALRGDAAACEEPLRIMDRQFSHLVHLVDDLLDVSRISRGKVELHKEWLDLTEVIHAALEMSESGLSRGDRHVTVSVPSGPLAVEGDRVRLTQVIANLLNNAAKFTDGGGCIDIRVTLRGEWVEIHVQDDGRGIPRERLDKIFEMFSQAEPGPGAGLGIGLSLVRRLVEMHGGTVGAASEGPGCGATFTVSLPLCGSVPAQTMTDPATEPDVLPTRCRVLVVDDNRDITKSLDMVLTMLGAEVRVAHDGAGAIRIFDDWPPTHVLMDLGMPGMDGYEAARRLRAKPADHAFRLVALTGWGQEEDRQQVREAGFDEHLVKPVGVAELKAALSR
jgi:PAS domain S-box-containing protein